MSTATYQRARLYACPDGHAGQHGAQLRTIVPDGLGPVPACTACHQPMTTDGDPLSGSWRVDECCTPAGPDGRWFGPPRDPAACTRCFGTRRVVICTTCLLPGCPGDHGDTCLACDGTGRVDCAACDGEGHVYNEFSEDQGLCPDSRCVAGRVPCDACDGTGRKAGPLPPRDQTVDTAARPLYALGVDNGERGRVLVTGATGYVAGHCIVDLLARGYDVRAE